MPKLRRTIFFGHRIDEVVYDELARQHGISVLRVEREIAAAMLDMSADCQSKHPWRRIGPRR